MFQKRTLAAREMYFGIACVSVLLVFRLVTFFAHCRYKRILVLVSHSQDFLNGVCTNIIHFHKCGLVYYGVSY